MNIHLCNDEKFINKAVERFEKEYPNQNVFIIDSSKENNFKHVAQNERILRLSFVDPNIIQHIKEICTGYEDINLFVHCLNIGKARIWRNLKKELVIETYWIFYGIDLYRQLYKNNKYELYDENLELSYYQSQKKALLRRTYIKIFKFREERILDQFIKEVDYFCFWNHYDYSLLRKNYPTKAEYREFRYGAFNDFSINFKGYKTKSNTIMVNHSGSLTGNHFSILNKLDSIKIKSSFSKLIVPLNYGSEEKISKINNYCLERFPEHYNPILEFLKKENYYQIISGVDVAFFGHRRQEAGGNINYLLAMGTKIFLRKSNNLVSFYRDIGIIVFTIEDDFLNQDDLKPLSLEIQKSNREIIMKELSESKVQEMYRNLIRD